MCGCKDLICIVALQDIFKTFLVLKEDNTSAAVFKVLQYNIVESPDREFFPNQSTCLLQ
eukprot:c2384_g1_i1 orf=3-176(-)